jgi:hypothetical protein
MFRVSECWNIILSKTGMLLAVAIPGRPNPNIPENLLSLKA